MSRWCEEEVDRTQHLPLWFYLSQHIFEHSQTTNTNNCALKKNPNSSLSIDWAQFDPVTMFLIVFVCFFQQSDRERRKKTTQVPRSRPQFCFPSTFFFIIFYSFHFPRLTFYWTMPPKERGGEKVHTHTHTHTRLQQRGPALGILPWNIHTKEGHWFL